MARGPIPDFPRDRPTIPEVAPLIQRFYQRDENFNGGSLHIVLEDGNIEPSHCLWCMYQALANGDLLGARIAYCMIKMTPTQRRKLYRIAGWIAIAPEKRIWRGIS